MEGVDAMAGSKARSSGGRAQSDMHGRVSTSACPHRRETRVPQPVGDRVGEVTHRHGDLRCLGAAGLGNLGKRDGCSPALAQLRFEQIGLRSKPRGLRVLP